eukprot:g2347.t1
MDPLPKNKRKRVAGKRKKKKKRTSKVASSAVVRSARGDKKLRSKLEIEMQRQEDAAEAARKTELLLTEDAGYLEAEGRAKTQKFKQKDIRDAVDEQSSHNVFDLKLETFGPYRVAYTRNGRFMLLSGEKGHTAMMDCQTFRTKTELHLRETARDCCFLMNETMFAVAQRKYLYIYDQTGMELHCLRNHVKPYRLEYLPYHYLLCSVGETGYLKYQDVSTGDVVAELRTRRGSCDVMRQNPHNAVMCLGHHNGVVSMWSPSMSTPLVQMFCHHGPVRDVAVDRSGRYMVSSGSDGQMKIWDLRTYKMLNAYFTTTPASSIDLSQRGMLAVGYGPNVQIWKDIFRTKQKMPYMRHFMPGCAVANLRYRPYEDVLAVGHSKGMSSMLVPGSGEPNYDAYEANPFETTKQRREGDVHKLLEKIPSDLITLDFQPSVGDIDRAPAEVIARERKIAMEANEAERNKHKKVKKKMRGKNKIGKRIKKHQRNIWDAKRKLAEKKKTEAREKLKAEKRRGAEETRTALSRFNRQGD